jgi:short-subunit dehydrogenase
MRVVEPVEQAFGIPVHAGADGTLRRLMRRAPLPIAGRTIAITGGARGIGAATAEALRRRGARVVVGDLDGGDHFLDVTSRASFAEFLAAAGDVDVLINNAGVLHVGPFLETSEDWTRRQIEINLIGVINGMQAALPGMLARRRGHVVNVASAAAKIGVKNEAVYAASKHGVYGVSESVRHELRGTGVELSVVMPGLVRTELAAGTTDAKGTVVLKPEDVADAICVALEKPRFDVYVPRSYGALFRTLAPLPRPAREVILRAVGAERATKDTTRADRAAYEDRVAGLYDQSKN